jgi:phospholipid transport system substrate-binding protein
MPTRRTQLMQAGLAVGLAWCLAGLPGARAQGVDAAAFVRQTGDQLINVVNGNAPESVKRQQLQQVVDRTVDVESIARFALGRFWRLATPQQQQEYMHLFHEVLLNSITAKLGEYRGVRFTVGRSVPQEGTIAVQTTIFRPNSGPTEVQWLIANVGGSPRIEDVVAEGTSLRITQRSDYVSYLQHNGDNVQALINALRQQLAQANG